MICPLVYFYPRSPCGERRPGPDGCTGQPAFLSTLSLRRATVWPHQRYFPVDDFYPRSPCGERPSVDQAANASTLNFYPRSPCGERLGGRVFFGTPGHISIHALLAESDPLPQDCPPGQSAFLSTLSLRRATSLHRLSGSSSSNFYPRSPCGERHTSSTQCRL